MEDIDMAFAAAIFPSSPSRAGRARQQGYSIYDLLTTLAVIAVVAGGAASFAEVLQHHRLVTDVNTLLASLQFARSEAIKRSGTVTVCTSADGARCTAHEEWQNGWLVFADDNGNRQLDPGEAVLRVEQALGLGMSATFRAALAHNNDVTYDRHGAAFPNGTFTLCGSRRKVPARAVIILGTGRARVSDRAADGGSLRCP